MKKSLGTNYKMKAIEAIKRGDFFRTLFCFIKKRMIALYKKSRMRIKAFVFRKKHSDCYHMIDDNYGQSNMAKVWRDFLLYDLPIVPEHKPFVSVIVPNYNHAAYLRQRLESIYNQTYDNYEVILLDDCSSDSSREILMEYAEKYPEKTRYAFNEKNTGKVFVQWNKGLSMANGDYIWIAESDDWCDLNFLEVMVPRLEYQSVMLAFSHSDFIKNGEKTWSTEEYLWDLTNFTWDKPFTISAHQAVNLGFALKNLIPNVSSALFRNIGQIPAEITTIWNDLKLCGDWIFYLFIAKGGAISYTNETNNYYRIHEKSTSLQVQETANYYSEVEKVSCYIAENYNVDASIFKQTKAVLKMHSIEHGNKKKHNIDELYSLQKIQEACDRRKPTVAMCIFSMQIGGGETFPINLAVEMHRQQVNIMVIDFNMQNYDPKVRKMLSPGIPMVHLSKASLLSDLLEDAGIMVVHSHHGSVDNLVSTAIQNKPQINQVITLHGMYEAITKKDLDNLLANVRKTCRMFFYIAEKNLVPFEGVTLREGCELRRMNNALLPGIPEAEDLSKYGIPADSFVLCLCSRAIFEKGWVEAVEAVKKANEKSKRPIHLLLLGSGEAYEALKSQESPYIHLTGMQSNTRAFFLASDMGFLPSRFNGESVPLVIIDSLMCGKPVIASKIGEIPYQLTLDNGDIAGELFELDDWTIDTDKLSDIICKIANDEERYEKMCKCVPEAAKKFEITKVTNEYLAVYQEVCT